MNANSKPMLILAPLALLALLGLLALSGVFSPTADAQPPGATEFEELEDFQSRESIPVGVAVSFPVDI